MIAGNQTKKDFVNILFIFGVCSSVILSGVTLYLTSKEFYSRKNESISFAVGLPASSQISKSLIDGIILAQKEFGVTHGKKIELVINDTGDASGDPVFSKEINFANEVAANPEVQGYIGPLTSSAAEVVVPILNKGYVVNALPIASASFLTRRGYRDGYPKLLFPTTYRTLQKISPNVHLSSNAVADHFSEASLGILEDATQYSYSLTSYFSQEQSTAARYELDTINYENIDVVFVAIPYTKKNATVLFEKISKAPKNITFVFNDSFEFSEEFLQYSKTATNPVFLTSLLPNILELSEYSKPFTEKFTQFFGYKPDQYSFLGYDAYIYLYTLINNSALTTRGSYIKTLQSLKSFDGSYAKNMLSEYGEIKNTQVHLYQFQNGNKDIVKTFEYEE